MILLDQSVLGIKMTYSSINMLLPELFIKKHGFTRRSHYRRPQKRLKETRSVSMNIFRKKYFLFKSFVKIELSYIFTINMVSTAENCKEK